MRLFKLLPVAVLAVCCSATPPVPVRRDTPPRYRVAPDGKTKIALPTKEQLDFQDNEIGALIHFEMATFTGSEACPSPLPGPSVFDPSEIDTDQWMDSIAALGAKFATLTAKHNCGFTLWPSKVKFSTSDKQIISYNYTVEQSPVHDMDIVKDFVDSARERNIGPGLYYSMPNNKFLNIHDHVFGPTPVGPGQVSVDRQAYDKLAIDQVSELWTQYGKFTEIWFDGGYLEGQSSGITKLLQEHQSQAVGFGGCTAQGRCVIANPVCDTTLQTGKRWFFGKGQALRSFRDMVDVYHNSRGLIPDDHAALYKQLGDFINSCYGKPVATEAKHTKHDNGTYSITFESPTSIDRIVLMEDQRDGQVIRSYQVQAKMVSGVDAGNWSLVSKGTSIGHKKIDIFEKGVINVTEVMIMDTAPAIEFGEFHFIRRGDVWIPYGNGYRLLPLKRTLDYRPPDRADKRAKVKGRTNTRTWNEARHPNRERGEKARDSSYHEIWYCKHCDSSKKPNSVTTNLSRARKHLRDFHGIRVVEQVEGSDLKKQQHGTITDMFGRQEERQAYRDLDEEKHLVNAVNIPAFEEALARLLAVRNIAHTFIEYPEFHAAIHSCNYMARDVLLRSRRAVPKLLENTFALHKHGLVEKLHNSLSSMVHFTIDMWTSSEQKAAYQAIVAHFVDAETREVAQALLSLREFKDSHSGGLQAKVFLEVVEEYELSEKVGYFTTDNHEANDTMLEDIAKGIEGLDPVARRLRCSGHIMNLIVQAFLSRSKAKKIQEDEQEGIDEAYERLCRQSETARAKVTKAQATEEWREFKVLGKLHNLCIYSRSSSSIHNDFKAKIGRALPRDNDTRWNSWFRLIDVAIERRAKFMDWIQEHHAKVEKDALDHNDWNELREIHAFLQVFHQISVRQGRENTLDEVLSHMDFLHHHFIQTQSRAISNPRFYARFHVAWLKFEKYYQLTEQAPVYVAGILLHPALRKSYLSEQWKRNPAWVSNAVKAVKQIWSTEYKSYQLLENQQESVQELDEFDRWRRKVYSSASEVKDEFDRFIYGSPVGIGQQTALQWWLEPTQQANFPLLSRMAIDVFCIPPMSTEAERIFSGARRQVTWDRSSMSAKMVEACECIKSWISVPKGKTRPLLAGVFRAAKDIDAAVRILQEDIEADKGPKSDVEAGDLQYR
ncbi:transposase-like protein [Purpureocillium lavendulum]|uniref:alpha-L-fucosidase n=1 Tax=Purpureocillium lavendulum TaxID=1247861 RepID=A0AB34FDF9_9HYPO|nr:transposase-like protein [Purpureocillium lavendulum]